MRVPAIGLAVLSIFGLTLAHATEKPPEPNTPPSQTTQPPEDPAQAKKEAYDNEIVCRTEDEIGTRLRKTKICMTRKEWRTGQSTNTDTSPAVQKNDSPSGIGGN